MRRRGQPLNRIVRGIRGRLRTDAGFTLVELIVTMMLFGVIAAMLFDVVMNFATTSTAIRQSTDLNEEARLVLNRMSRELREAQSIVSVVNPMGVTATYEHDPNADTLVTFEVDFNGNGTIEPNAADPEVITYKHEFKDEFDVELKRLLIQAGGETLPILAGNVEAFNLTFTSKKWECDTDGDGIVTWEELDSALSPCPDSVGNADGELNVELAAIDSIAIELSMLIEGRRQDYRTQVDLRNRTS
jgi:prepilin-type N-terminal cleavage/methylation domain-containing protein